MAEQAAQEPGIYQEIRSERQRQDARWGGPEHDDEHDYADFHGYIQSHLNEAYDVRSAGVVTNEAEWRRVMIQVAALVVAALESHDRKC